MADKVNAPPSSTAPLPPGTAPQTTSSPATSTTTAAAGANAKTDVAGTSATSAASGQTASSSTSASTAPSTPAAVAAVTIPKFDYALLDKRLGFFITNPSLSDCILIFDRNEYRAHRVILAASSRFFYQELVLKVPEGAAVSLPIRVAIPTPKTSEYLHTDAPRGVDVLRIILEYVYANQDPLAIASEQRNLINDESMGPLLAYAHALGIPSLCELVGHYIAERHVHPDKSVVEYLLVALRYDVAALKERCIKMILGNFNSLADMDDGVQLLSLLPLDTFVSIVNEDQLNVTSESVVFFVVKEYLKKRTGLLTLAEEEKRQADQTSKTPSDGSVKADTKPAADPLRPRGLTQEEKIRLLSCVRFAFLTHHQLLEAKSDRLVDAARDMILDGISVRLDKHEPGKKNVSYCISLQPRESYNVKKTSTNRPSGSGEGQADNTRNSERVPSMNVMKKAVYASAFAAGPGTSVAKTSRPTDKHLSPVKASRSMDNSYAIALEKASKSIPKAVDTPPLQFVYRHDFDENGVFFYLGTSGRTQGQWHNPHELGQVVVHASSLGAGQLDDFVGRDVTNCRTRNEPGSWFAVDLGEGRLLQPSRYTLRNRFAGSHVLVSWELHGSADGHHWVTIDRHERDSTLRMPGTSATWDVQMEPPIADAIFPNDDHETAFRFFRLLQIGKNSSGSDNLVISGCELYGRAVGGKWV
eukprot:GILK01012475.1.p1 GENE.GILK01012475.1~~GILK01012475.1.p1  ORF type:complete len:714 (+),score=102.50 GILK01012475.1:44-2143(+)